MEDIRKLCIENSGGWQDGSAGKSTNCSFEGSEFKSQQHGGSQPSVTKSDVYLTAES